MGAGERSRWGSLPSLSGIPLHLLPSFPSRTILLPLLWWHNWATSRSTVDFLKFLNWSLRVGYCRIIYESLQVYMFLPFCHFICDTSPSAYYAIIIIHAGFIAAISILQAALAISRPYGTSWLPCQQVSSFLEISTFIIVQLCNASNWSWTLEMFWKVFVSNTFVCQRLKQFLRQLCSSKDFFLKCKMHWKVNKM